jgi:hypothetical protein
MNVQLFAVYDAAAMRFIEPFPAPTIEFAIREFRSTVNREGSQIHKYPEDYTLFHIGEFDQETGFLLPLQAPHSLGVAITFKDEPKLTAFQEQNVDA